MAFDLASLYFGLFIGIFGFTCSKAFRQTFTIWKRTHSFHHAYPIMVWAEATVNLIFAVTTYLHINDIIPPSLGFYIFSVLLWAVQTQLLPQIIANRVALIMMNRQRSRYLKLGLFLLIGCINIAVGFIWVPAQMPGASEKKQYLNFMFERAEKTFLLIVDVVLSAYFLYLVRYRLIEDGLTKYWRLFNINIAAVIISTMMDILLISFVGLSDSYLYIQWAPTAYIVKLYIELVMANMISRVVRSNGASAHGAYIAAVSQPKSDPANYMASHVVVESGCSHARESRHRRGDRGGSEASAVELAAYPSEQGIRRTIETTVVVDSDRHGP